MSKIKSARELAMERTAGLKESHGGDSGQAAGEQYIKAAATMAGALLQGKTDLERVMESINRYPAVYAAAAKQAFVKALIDGITPENCDPVLEAYPAVYPERKESREMERLREFHGRYRDSMAAERRVMEEKETGTWRAYLREKGIRGSAAGGINLERFPGWQVKQAEAAARFSAELAKIKAELLADSNNP